MTFLFYISSFYLLGWFPGLSFQFFFTFEPSYCWYLLLFNCNKSLRILRNKNTQPKTWICHPDLCCVNVGMKSLLYHLVKGKHKFLIGFKCWSYYGDGSSWINAMLYHPTPPRLNPCGYFTAYFIGILMFICLFSWLLFIQNFNGNMSAH